jgi:non-ribosomal peptide synthase protein (TIGR01720 family)
VAQLALAAGAGPVVQAEQGLVEGPVPLTPIQRWFFEQEWVEPHHWNQAVMLEVEQALEPDLLETTITRLLEHHDALRLRFERVSESASKRVSEAASERVGESANRRVGESANRRISEPGWRQINVGVNEDAPFERFDLSNLSNPEQKAALEARASALQASLDLTAEPLMRVAYFDLGPEQPDRLLMVVHHLAIDGVSWRILLEDFQTAYEQLRRGETVQLPPKTTSFQRWARRLSTHAQSEAVQAELPHWLSIAESKTLAVPVDFPEGANTEASAQSVAVSLSVEETEALLKEVPAAYRVEINDALLTALAQAMSRWTGAPTTPIELEGHGREDLWEDIDVSRTVGWFTTIYPVALQLTRSAGPGEALMAVKEQLRQIPNRGLGYGLLRYLSQDAEIVRQLRALPHPEVSFNYLGQFDQALDASSPFRLAEEAIGPDRSPKELRSHLLDINGSIIQGRLRLEWTYSENLHRRATIQRVSQDFAQALRALIAHCRSGEAGGVTPSDFKLADLSQRELDKVLAKINRK